jgi:hypothetical protein
LERRARALALLSALVGEADAVGDLVLVRALSRALAELLGDDAD